MTRILTSTVIIFLVVTVLQEVKGNLWQNVAEGRPTYQSSVYSYLLQNGEYMYGDSWLAVDGNTDTNFTAGSCMHTDANRDPWWMVDLGRLCVINGVEITRTTTFTRRLINFTIETSRYLTGNASEGVLVNPVLCYYHEPEQLDSTVVYPCYKTVMGRFVKITRHFTADDRRIGFCEFQVHGTDMSRFYLTTSRPGKRSLNPLVDIYHVSSTARCSSLCLESQSCTSVNIQLRSGVTKTCELIADPVPWIFDNEESNGNWTHIVFT